MAGLLCWLLLLGMTAISAAAGLLSHTQPLCLLCTPFSITVSSTAGGGGGGAGGGTGSPPGFPGVGVPLVVTFAGAGNDLAVHAGLTTQGLVSTAPKGTSLQVSTAGGTTPLLAVTHFATNPNAPITVSATSGTFNIASLVASNPNPALLGLYLRLNTNAVTFAASVGGVPVPGRAVSTSLQVLSVSAVVFPSCAGIDTLSISVAPGGATNGNYVLGLNNLVVSAVRPDSSLTAVTNLNFT
ncbi:hypothetical protein WJX81_005536 [Elliptochloris bilobata]|uniref:Uncharacterized protein n=1 Tax=Elliptochloris bilobata TaxID=381761 RepID=A0AAW1SHG6_9CHLO